MIRSRVVAWLVVLGMVGTALAITPPSAAEDVVYGTVYGTVTGGDGQPMRGAVVGALSRRTGSWSGEGSATTDSNGRYALPVRIGVDVRIKVEAEAAGYSSKFWPDEAKVEYARDLRVTTAQPTRSGVDLQIGRPGSISGHVVGDSGPLPLEASVGVYDDHNESVSGAFVDAATGRFEIPHVPPGTYRVWVTSSEYTGLANEWLHDRYEFATADPVVVGSGENLTGIEVELEEGGRITGTVRAAPGAALTTYTPVYALQRRNGEWSAFRKVYADETGRYEVAGLGTGDYYVRTGTSETLQAFYPDAAEFSDATQVHVVVGETTRDIDLVLRPPGQLSGRVTTDGGTPIAGVPVSVYFKDGTSWFTSEEYSTQTGPNGEYLVDAVYPGGYRVAFGEPGYAYNQEFWPNAPSVNDATDVVVGVSQHRTGIDGRLDPASAIGGRLTSRAGSPLPAIAVASFLKTATGYRRVTSFDITDRDGRYRLTGLAPGRYRLSFTDTRTGIVYYSAEYWNRDGGAEALADGTDVVLPRSSSRSGVNAQLERGATVSGRALDESGFPFALSLRASRFENGRWRTQSPPVNVPPGGRFSLRLDAGRFRLAFLGTDHQVLEWWDNAVRFGRARDIKLKPGTHFTGVNAKTTGAMPPPQGHLSVEPGLAGRPVVGETLEVTPVAATPGSTLRYQWYLGEQKVPGATSPKLRIEQSMVGRQVAVLVTESKSSLATRRLLVLAGPARNP
jgi:hypothetical protein